MYLFTCSKTISGAPVYNTKCLLSARRTTRTAENLFALSNGILSTGLISRITARTSFDFGFNPDNKARCVLVPPTILPLSSYAAPVLNKISAAIKRDTGKSESKST